MNKEQCLKLIQLYSEHRHLWDAQCPDYNNRRLREDAWRNINLELNLNIPLVDIKKKMDSLLGSYRREKSREKKSRNSWIIGSGRGEIYQSNWYAHEAFSFLGEKRNNPGNTQDHLDEQNARQVEILNGDSHNVQVKKVNETRDHNSMARQTEEQTQKSTTRAKKRPKQTNDNLSDHATSETLSLMQQCANDNVTSEKNDHYNVYGQYIANELRKYDALTLAHVKHAINKIIFEADIGAYNSYYTPSFSGQDSSNNTPRPSSSSMPSTSPMRPSTTKPLTSFIKLEVDPIASSSETDGEN